MNIIIDPRIKYNYASYYLLGIQQTFKKTNISYKVEPFADLPYNSIRDLNCGMAFIIKRNNLQHNIFIDFEDVARIDPIRYKWANVYAKVNPTAEQISDYPKLFAIGPGFGITLNNIFVSALKCCINFYRGGDKLHIPFRTALRDYIYTNIRRRRIEQYERKIPVRENYIFHASTLWYNKFAATDTNKWRGDFLLECRRAGIDTEGGLFYINGNDPVSEMPNYPFYKEIYKDFIYDKRLSMDSYIRKTKQSTFVFNTPSVCECHGWKLAEYLCMGKAIISTPLTREMPGEGLIHGVNVHFVHTKKELYEAIIEINNNETYREKLQCGAREYYEKYISPKVVIQRIMKRANETK